MKKAWRIILIIVVIAIAVGAVSAGVGILTGADFERVSTTLEERIAQRYNVDADRFVHEWIPESVQIIRDELAPTQAPLS